MVENYASAKTHSAKTVATDDGYAFLVVMKLECYLGLRFCKIVKWVYVQKRILLELLPDYAVDKLRFW